MEIQKQANITFRASKQIGSLSLDKAELRRLCETLQERSRDASKLEVADYRQLQQTDEQYEKNKKLLGEGFELKFTILGSDGEELFGSLEDVFESPNFPELVKSVYVNSESGLRTQYNYYPLNSFQLYLDFSKPAVFEHTVWPSAPTPNDSKITVQGQNASWVNGIFNEVSNYFDKKGAAFEFFHKQSVYDFLLWILGYPLTFWACYKLSGSVNTLFGRLSVFVESAAYFYIFLVSLYGLGIIFSYSRWVWPLVEYRGPSNKALRHRAVLGTLVLTIVGAFLYDVIKEIMK